MHTPTYSGIRALVMGLGLNGGGAEAARYLAEHGADVTVTDLRDERTLASSLEQIEAGGRVRFRYVLGRHEMDDFTRADMVIKNPGVRPDSPYLAASIAAQRQVATDISLFLRHSPARLIAVTGSKGKSSTASAVHWILNQENRRGKAFLGGNITVSPLSFLDRLTEEDDVVLELSSWQLGDLPLTGQRIKPRTAILTSIMPDHQDRYGSLDAYVADKRLIYAGQDRSDVTIADDSSWGRLFLHETPGRSLVYTPEPVEQHNGAWLGADGTGYARRAPGAAQAIVPATLQVPGAHQRKNLLAAALAAVELGVPADAVREALGRFPGIEHRLEWFITKDGRRFYNDTAATIPEAAAAAVAAFDAPPILVTGGTDKALDFTPLVTAAAHTKARILLAGTGSEKLRTLFDAAGLDYFGPFDSVDAAVQQCFAVSAPGDAVVFSPGCASFGMFLNEFDRGRQWKHAVVHA